MSESGENSQPLVAIVDYGLGNLFSVKHACESTGIRATITSSPDEIGRFDAVILPGVGAFGDAMKELEARDLVAPLRDVVASGTPIVGICLGMQLLMSESSEFGHRKGLAIIEGEVVRFPEGHKGDRRLKVPHVGWSALEHPSGDADAWEHTLLDGQSDGVFMYFVHSYYASPSDIEVTLSSTRYGQTEFCSSLRQGNVYGFQCHPERSGPDGLGIYSKLKELIHQGEIN